MMVGGIIMAAREDIGLSWLVLAVVPVLGISIGLIVRQMVPSFRLMQERIDEVNRLLREQITGVRVVRAFVREEHETARFADANAAADRRRRSGPVAGRPAMFPTVMIVANVATVGVLWFGGHRVENGHMEVGALTAYISYLMQIVMSVMMAMFMLMMVPRAAVCADRITEVLDTESSVVPPSRPGHRACPSAARPRARRRHLRLPRRRRAGAARGHADRAARARRVAIVGSTGAGKSTLVNLVPRLFDATGGAVRVGGVDVRRPRPGDAVVAARAGAAEGLPLPRDRRRQPALRQARRHRRRDVGRRSRSPRRATSSRRCPTGSQAEIAQGGTSLSGGQRQRMAIARAVIRRPDIYLFDDSFSALDLTTDARLRAALRPVTRDATVVIVAQRVATIRHADRIVVMEDGAVVGTRHPRRAARDLRDLPGDRRVPAHRGGGRMSTDDEPPRPQPGTLKETERVQSGPGGPGRGPMGGGMIGQKADTFWPSLKRLLARLRPERHKAYAVLVLTVAQRGRSPPSAPGSSAGRPT